jgi:hypothetical protein
MNAEEMKLRTKRFALRIMKLADSLPRSPSGRTLAGQIVRSGTSVAANYRTGRRARAVPRLNLLPSWASLKKKPTKPSSGLSR